MPRTPCLLIVALLCATTHAGPLDGDVHPDADQTETKLLHVYLAKDRDSEPTTKFSTDAMKIVAFWKGNTLTAGDKIRAVWMAEDVGSGTLTESKIMEGSVTAYKPDDDGAFALARPKEGWPAGKYRVDIYVGRKIDQSLKFTIESDAAVEVDRK